MDILVFVGLLLMQLSFIWKGFKAGGFKSFCYDIFQGPRPRRAWHGLVVAVNLLFLSVVYAKPASQQPFLEYRGSTNSHFSDLSFEYPLELNEINNHWAKALFETLSAHWQPTDSDPVDLKAELQTIAVYYSQFPNVREMLITLGQYEWSLRYAKKRYSTEVFVRRGPSYSVRVNFDPSSAAQYVKNSKCTLEKGRCIATPADVLLHELLHAQQILKDPVAFIENHAQVGAGYPHKHEADTIALEQTLYELMSKVDSQPRPIRSKHAGLHVGVACAVCLE